MEPFLPFALMGVLRPLQPPPVAWELCSKTKENLEENEKKAKNIGKQLENIWKAFLPFANLPQKSHGLPCKINIEALHGPMSRLQHAEVI